MMNIHIIEIETGNEAHAIRAAAECWGANVSLTWVGNSGQIVEYLSSSPAHDLIIISGHGTSTGLLLPELHESVKDNYPFDKQISPEELATFVELAGTPVLNLSCETGTSSFADAFLSCGTQIYIGPVDAVDGNAALMYALEFLYAVLVDRSNIIVAHKSATDHEDDRALFKLYDNGAMTVNE